MRHRSALMARGPHRTALLATAAGPCPRGAWPAGAPASACLFPAKRDARARQRAKAAVALQPLATQVRVARKEGAGAQAPARAPLQRPAGPARRPTGRPEPQSGRRNPARVRRQGCGACAPAARSRRWPSWLLRQRLCGVWPCGPAPVLQRAACGCKPVAPSSRARVGAQGLQPARVHQDGGGARHESPVSCGG